MKTQSHTSTSDAIAESGFRVLSKNPGANVAEIADEAGITRATLHRYFPSRKNLIEALAQRAVAEMEAAVEAACAEVKSAGEGLQKSLAALIPLGDRHGFLAHEQFDHDAAIEQEFIRIQGETAEWIESAKREGVFDPHVPTAWINRTFDYLLYCAWDSVRAQETTISQAADLAWRTLAAGVGGRHDR
ncbi:MAG: helix-turn-helix domain-containing protein [Pseudomonadota bacterium]